MKSYLYPLSLGAAAAGVRLKCTFSGFFFPPRVARQCYNK